MNKKNIRIIAIALGVWLLVGILFLGVVFWNDLLLGNMTRSFRRGIQKSDAAVELLEVESVLGKLNANSNGINYFGAALVTAETPEDMDTLVTELSHEFDVEYVLQEGSKVNAPYLEHEDLIFEDTQFEDGQTYYCIYFYLHEHPRSNIFDIRGY